MNEIVEIKPLLEAVEKSLPELPQKSVFLWVLLRS